MSGVTAADSGTSTSTSGSSPAPASSGPTTAAAALTAAAAAQTAPSPAGTAGTNGTATGNGSGQAVATQQPPTPATGQPQSTQGPIPFDVHRTALENARAKAAEQALQPYAWAKDLKQEQVERAMRVIAMLDGDPRAFRSQLEKELGEQDDTMPEPDFVGPDGKSKFFSAETMSKALQVIENRLRRELQGKVDPLLQEREEAAQRAKAEQVQATQRAQVKEALDHIKTMPFWNPENEKLIGAEMEALPKATVQQLGVVGAMYVAVANFVAKHQGRLSAAAKGEVLEDLTQKAAAAAGQVAPTGAQPQAGPPKIKGVEGLAKHMERLAAGQGT